MKKLHFNVEIFLKFILFESEYWTAVPNWEVFEVKEKNWKSLWNWFVFILDFLDKLQFLYNKIHDHHSFSYQLSLMKWSLMIKFTLFLFLFRTLLLLFFLFFYLSDRNLSLVIFGFKHWINNEGSFSMDWSLYYRSSVYSFFMENNLFLYLTICSIFIH